MLGTNFVKNLEEAVILKVVVIINNKTRDCDTRKKIKFILVKIFFSFFSINLKETYFTSIIILLKKNLDTNLFDF